MTSLIKSQGPRFEIKPGVGLSTLRLGSSLGEVEEWVENQEDDFIRDEEDGGIMFGSKDLRLGVELDDSAEGGRGLCLAYVDALSSSAVLMGRPWFGLGELELRRALGDPSESSREHGTGFAHLYYSAGQLETCWFYLSDNRVIEFSVGPRYSSDGRSAIWP